jgi:hypothetical protein
MDEYTRETKKLPARSDVCMSATKREGVNARCQICFRYHTRSLASCGGSFYKMIGGESNWERHP